MLAPSCGLLWLMFLDITPESLAAFYPEHRLLLLLHSHWIHLTMYLGRRIYNYALCRVPCCYDGSGHGSAVQRTSPSCLAVRFNKPQLWRVCVLLGHVVWCERRKRWCRGGLFRSEAGFIHKSCLGADIQRVLQVEPLVSLLWCYLLVRSAMLFWH